MKNKLNVLEVNNVDLPGRRFNGYDLMNDIKNDEVSIKQAVVYKQSNNNKVVKILKDYNQMLMLEKLEDFESKELSVHSNLSITSPALIASEEYKEADILHFHMFHNTKLSLISLLQMCNEKKVVMSFHDPWSITGRCVHFEECMKWKTGCKNCEKLNTLFPFNQDNCNSMWNLKKMIYEKINPHIVVSSKYMYDLIKESPLTKHFENIDIIPLGVNLDFFSNRIPKEVARKKFNIPNTDIVLFLRAQKAFKGTEYIVEALRNLKSNKNITVLTCGEKNHFNKLKDKYNIIDMGLLNDEQLLYAYNACDMFLMPSIGETFGMMAVEAMACEKPVVIFNNTALPAVTFAPECGVLVENKSSKKLMEAIEELINNEEERIRRGKLGRKICEEHYSINKYNESLVELYKTLGKENKENQKLHILDNPNHNDKKVKKIQNKLNEFTRENFKEDSKEYNELIYKKAEKEEGKIDYSNLEVQKIINEYNNKLYNTLYDNITNVKTNNIFVQVKNAMVLLVKDRTRLKNSIQYKFQQIFKKKE